MALDQPTIKAKPNDDGLKIIEKTVTFEDGLHNEGLIIREDQHIPDEFFTALEDERAHNAAHRAGEFHRVASIPTGVADWLLRQGYDIWNEPVQKTVWMLRALDMAKFVTSNKV